MHCQSCGNALLPQSASCPNCGSPTPYNIDTATPNQLDSTVPFAASSPLEEASPGFYSEQTVQVIPPSQTPVPSQQLSFNPVEQGVTQEQQESLPQPNSQPLFAAPPQSPVFSEGLQQQGPFMSPPSQQLPPTYQQQGPFMSPPSQQLPPTYQQQGPFMSPPSQQLPPTFQEQGAFMSPPSQQLPPTYQQQGAPYYPAAQSPLIQQTTAKRGLSGGMIALLITLIVLLLLGGSGLIYYTTVFHPAEISAQATMTAQTLLTAQAHATSTANAQATGTAIAIQSTATAQAVATTTAQQQIYTQATSGTPALTDPLKTNSLSWYSLVPQAGVTCNIRGGALHAQSTITQTKTLVACIAPNTNFANFAYQVDLNAIQGNIAGLIFRSDGSTVLNFFDVETNTGAYTLTSLESTSPKIITAGVSSDYRVGQVNTLTLIARGTTIDLFINKQFVTEVQDTTGSNGQIGLLAGNTTSGLADMSYQI